MARSNRAEFSHSLVSEWSTPNDHSLTLSASCRETSVSLHQAFTEPKNSDIISTSQYLPRAVSRPRCSARRAR